MTINWAKIVRVRRYLKTMPSQSEAEQGRIIREQLERHMPRNDREQKGFSRFWAGLLSAVLVASWLGSGILAVHDNRRIRALEAELAMYRSNTVTEHNVTIVSRLDDGDFAYVSDEKPDGDTFRPCPVDLVNHVDVVGLLTQGIHYTADFAKWEERGVCRSILRADLGFWFTDKNVNFKHRGIN
jgi:hypothetical protein